MKTYHDLSRASVSVALMMLVACSDAAYQHGTDTSPEASSPGDAETVSARDDVAPDLANPDLDADPDLAQPGGTNDDDATALDVEPDATDTPDSTDSTDMDAAETQVIDPLGDTDKDGVMDLDELEDQTDPFDPRSVRSLRPDIVGHPRLFARPEHRQTMLARSQRESGPAHTLWVRVVQNANRPMPVHPPEAGYDTAIPPTQGQIAEAAALMGWVTGDLAMTDKALTVLAAEFPDPTPLNQLSAFNAGKNYNLLESEALAGFCSAYDLAAGTLGADPELLAAARARLIQRVDYFRTLCMTRGGCTTLLRTERNNHSLKSLAALGLCALAIPDHPKAVDDFHDAFVASHYLAHTYQGDPQGGWAESWNYLTYSADTHLSFQHAIHRATLDRREPGPTCSSTAAAGLAPRTPTTAASSPSPPRPTTRSGARSTCTPRSRPNPTGSRPRSTTPTRPPSTADCSRPSSTCPSCAGTGSAPASASSPESSSSRPSSASTPISSPSPRPHPSTSSSPTQRTPSCALPLG